MAHQLVDPIMALRALLARPDQVPDDARCGHRVTAPSPLTERQRDRLKRDLARAYLAHRLSEARPVDDDPRLVCARRRRRRPLALVWRREEGVA